MNTEHVYANWRSLIKPRKMEKDTHSSAVYGKFVVKPLERGFGITLGNAIRRVLLSSLQGAAVTSVKIEGVLHEFSSIPGVIEDVTDIILNVKGVLVRTERTEPFSVRIATSERPPPPTTGADAVIIGSAPAVSAVMMPPSEPPAIA